MADTSFLKEDRNPKVKPGDDFYEYAVGEWLKNNPVPDDQSRWGSFDQVIEENFRKLKNLLEKTDQFEGGPHKEIAMKIGLLYRLGMDVEKCNEMKWSPLKPYLKKIENIRSEEEIVKIAAELHEMDVRPFFNFYSTPDSKNSEWVIAGFSQGGMSLPEKEYYFSDNEKIKEIRLKFKEHVSKMFQLLGQTNNESKEAAEIVLEVETKLAEFSRTKVELRDPVKNYNKMGILELNEISPDWKWNSYFASLKFGRTSELDVGQPEFFSNIGKIFSDISLKNWKVYLIWHLLVSSADYLSDDFVEEKFDFYGRILQGQPKLRDRWKRVVLILDQLVGQGIGKMYVEKYFPQNAKERASSLVKNILSTMEERIRNLSWMGENTKQEALAKLRGIKVKIGFPDWWIDYSSLEINGNSFLDAVFSAKKFEFQRDLKKIGNKVNHEEWFIPPQMVNAFYNPLDNEIVFPAGILQPPFFFPDADDAVNYGGIGAVIGHEITHGFDDQGRQYDAKGNLRDWWTPDDETNFKKRAKNLVNQYSSCEVEGSKVNGELTLGENIADLGGIVISFTALQKVRAGKKNELIDGFTQNERFFLNFAQFFKTNTRGERALLLLKIDPHSPDKYRVNVPLSNLKEFKMTFKVEEEDKMFRSDNEAVSIW